MKWHPREGNVANVKLSQRSGDWVIVYPSTFGTVRIVEDANLLPVTNEEVYARVAILKPKSDRFCSKRARVLDVDVTLQEVDGNVGVKSAVTDPDLPRKTGIRRDVAHSDH